MIASCKLMHLLEAFSTPWFLLSTPNNHHLVFFLLEMFNNIIQVKLSNYYYNSHFRALRAFAPAPRRWSLAFHATPSDPMDQSNTLGLIMKAPKASSSIRIIRLLKKDWRCFFDLTPQVLKNGKYIIGNSPKNSKLWRCYWSWCHVDWCCTLSAISVWRSHIMHSWRVKYIAILRRLTKN